MEFSSKDYIVLSSLALISGIALNGIYEWVVETFMKPINEDEENENLQEIQKLVRRQRLELSRKTIILDEETLETDQNLKMKLESGLLKDTSNHLLNELKYLGSPICDIVRVPHLAHYLELRDFPNIVSPLLGDSKFRSVLGGEGFLPEESFIDARSFIINPAVFGPKCTIDTAQKLLRAGPRRNIFFRPSETRVAIVTCGGLCPGLNVVIRELVLCLHYNYRVKCIYGIQYGYKGFYSFDWVELTPDNTKGIHQQGGTILGTSRGGFHADKIVDKLQSNNINQVYIIGGDGTHRGIYELYHKIVERKLGIAIAGIPKTIDNDIPIIDRSFGFETSVQEAQRSIQSANIEANCLEYGIGLVKVMGRNSGYIAVHSSLASRDVNICLVPEFKFDLYGSAGLLEFIYKRLLVRRHCIIVVAEGAAEAIRDHELKSTKVDASGNQISADIGLFLQKEIVDYCKGRKLDATLKYIDPTYMIRTVQSNAYDTDICSMLAQNAINGAFAGFTAFTTGNVNNRTCLIPVELIAHTRKPKRISPEDRTWQRLLATTGQPSFLNGENELLCKVEVDLMGSQTLGSE